MTTPAEQIERFINAHPGEWREVPTENPDEMAFVLEVYPYRIKVEAYLSAVWGSLEHFNYDDTPSLDPCPVGASLLTQIAWQGADVLQAHGGSPDTLPPWLADPVRRTLRTRAGELLTLAGSSPADVVSAAETVDEALCGRPVVEPTLSAMLAALQGIGMSCRWVAGLPPDEDRSGDCDGPQAAHDYDEAYKAAAEYYDLLALLPDADRAEVDRLKARMDDLLAPTNDNPAYVVHQSFLRQKRLVTESLSERIVRARAEILRLDGVVTPEIMGEVLWNLRRVLGVTP